MRAGDDPYQQLHLVEEQAAIRVLIVDDQTLFAQAIGMALAERGFEVATSDGRAAMSAFERDPVPDIVLLDVHLDGRDGLETGRKILERSPDTSVIALTDAPDASVADEALASGFSGYLTKDAKIRRLVDVIHAAADGAIVAPKGLRRRSPATPTVDDIDAALLVAQLTSREMEVLEALVAGRSSGEIAAALYISPNTVRTHVQSILAKLGVHSRLEAATFASRHGVFANGRDPRRSPNVAGAKVRFIQIP